MTEIQIRNKVVATAKAWIGYNEADGSHKQIVDVYNGHKPLARGYALRYTDAWCAGYVSAVSIKCGLTDIMPTEVGVWNMIELYRKLGRWQESDSYVPKPGDVIMYAWDDNGVGDCTSGASHVGIVVSCDGKNITVIEGNKNNAVEYREIAVNGRYIRGFGLPDYGSKATEAETPTDTEETVYTVKAGDTLAGIAAKYGTTYQVLAEYNGIKNPNIIHVGQEIKIPGTQKAPEETDEVVNVEVRMLRKGMVGNDCRAAMLILKDKGYYPDAIPSTDNIFGPKMDAGVRKMQADNGLTVDGIIGPQTWASLLKR